MNADTRSLDDWLEYIGQVHVKDIDMGLDRIRQVAGRLEVLEPAPVSVIVAGTNGKGSTCMALERLLMADGVRVGTTVSPHVSRFNERLRVAGAELADEALCDLFTEVDDARGNVPLTYFEFSALAALLAFVRQEVEVAILEVGLGGRLDAFNLVDADLAIVTSIGLDHQDYLGCDLEQIGREKAGVFRSGQTVVLGSVTDSVRTSAAQLGCRILERGQDFQITEQQHAWSYRCDALKSSATDIPRGTLAPSNCALALTAATLLGHTPPLTSLAEVDFPGRLERHDLAGVPVLLDVAHNPAGAAFLANQLRVLFPGRRYVAIYGALADKDPAGVAAALGDLVTCWLTIGTEGWRSQSAVATAERLTGPATACASIGEALTKARSFRVGQDGIVVLGSFSAVEQARKLLTDCGEKRE